MCETEWSKRQIWFVLITLLCNMPSIVIRFIILYDKFELSYSNRFFNNEELRYTLTLENWVFKPLQFSTGIFMLLYLYADPYVRKLATLKLYRPETFKKRQSIMMRRIEELENQGGGNLSSYF